MSINTTVLTDQRPTYSLEPRDIAAYLALVGDNESVGVPCDIENCLLAETLKCKYNTDNAHVYVHIAEVNYHLVNLTHQMNWLRSAFDLQFAEGLPVEKSQLMAFLDIMTAEGAWTW